MIFAVHCNALSLSIIVSVYCFSCCQIVDSLHIHNFKVAFIFKFKSQPISILVIIWVIYASGVFLYLESNAVNHVYYAIYYHFGAKH